MGLQREETEGLTCDQEIGLETWLPLSVAKDEHWAPNLQNKVSSCLIDRGGTQLN